MLPRAHKKNSSFAQHLIDNNHDMYSIDDCLKILHVYKKGRTFDEKLEEYDILPAF